MKKSLTFSDYESSLIPKNKTASDTPSRSVAKGVRKRWEPRQKSLVLHGFRKQIKDRQFPTKDAILKFIKKHQTVFTVGDCKRIRTLVVNTYTFQK